MRLKNTYYFYPSVPTLPNQTSSRKLYEHNKMNKNYIICKLIIYLYNIKMIGNCIQIFDLVSPTIQLTHKKSNRLKSKIGGILTILTSLFTIYCVVYFGSDIVNKNTPISRFSKDHTNSSVINLADFPVIMYFSNRANKNYENIEKYIRFDPLLFDMEYNSETKSVNTKMYRLFMEPCNESHLGKHSKFFDGETPYREGYCLNPNKKVMVGGNGTIINDPVFIRNEFGGFGSVYISIRLLVCTNTTLEPTRCAPEEKINEVFSDILFVAHYADHYVDLNNYEKPAIPFLTSNVLNIPRQYQKANFLRIKNSYIDTDSGLILEDRVLTKFNQVESTTIDLIISPDKTQIMAFLLCSQKITDNYYRKYTKVQDLLADIGGLMKFLLTISSLLINFYSTNNFYFDLNNHFFNVKQSDQDRSQDSKIPDSNVGDLSLGVNNYVNSGNNTISPMKTSAYDYIKSVIKCKAHYNRTDYGKIKNNIMNFLEIDNVIKDSLNLGKLFHLLYDNNSNLIDEKAYVDIANNPEKLEISFPDLNKFDKKLR